VHARGGDYKVITSSGSESVCDIVTMTFDENTVNS